MRKTLSKLAGICVLAAGLGSGTTMAAPIVGGISITDGIAVGSLPPLPSFTIVSALTSISHFGGPGATFSCSVGDTFDIEGTCGQPASMTDWTFAGPYGLIITVDGFTFTLSGAGAVTPGAFTCNATAGTCSDTLTVAGLIGVVAGNGYDATAFTGSLALTGGCVGTLANGCTGSYTAGYTYSLTATGRPVQIPEPGTLALMGLGLAGLGLLRRRK